ncbi:HIT family protein [Streptomyces sp. NPDC001536]|uniref:HIT family protein n=1 Tax=Streptomyces sp. NPDC001536 TaxID=3364583 RepID=UPI0036952ED0
MEECDFCSIASGRAPANVIWEDEASLAFFPLRPAAVGHTLVIPKSHYEDLFETPQPTLSSLIQAVTLVGRGLRAALGPDGLNVINSAGEAASQTVFHVHVHVVPRWHGDHFGDIWPPNDAYASEVKDEIAEMVRQTLSP